MATEASRSTAPLTTGSVMRHVAVMTATGSVGLVAVFVVDALNLFYIALLGEQELAAAVGYAGTLLFLVISIGIGVMIAATALVSRALGAARREEARRLAGSGLVYGVVVMGAVSLALMPVIEPVLGLLGATGRTREIAAHFLWIVVPSNAVMGFGMVASGILRATGDARRAMYVTLAGGLAAAVLDPLLIFGLDLGITGAAIATVLSRFLMAAVGWHGMVNVHGIVARPRLSAVATDGRALSAIAVPAILTNVATPAGNAWVTAALAPFGDSAVAGWAVIGRLIPLAFGALFALSGAVGPVFGQNLGAGRYDRVRRTLVDSLIFATLVTLVAWALLALAARPLADAFGLTGTGADLVVFFCRVVAGTFLFMGALFVANAAFNNLGFATYSTVFNWGRATVGTVPLVWLGAAWWGAEGVILGQGLGSILFGLAAVWTAHRVIGRLGPGAAVAAGPPLQDGAPAPFGAAESALPPAGDAIAALSEAGNAGVASEPAKDYGRATSRDG